MDAAFQPKQAATGVGLDWKSGVGCGWLRRIGLHKGSFFNWITSYRRVHTRMPTFFPIDLLAGPPSATYGTAAEKRPTSSSLSTTTRKMPLECLLLLLHRAKLLAVAFDTEGVPWRRDKKKKGGRRRRKRFLSWYVLERDHRLSNNAIAFSIFNLTNGYPRKLSITFT